MRIEHVNLTVHDLERSIAFYRHVFGWDVRWRGEILNTTRTAPAAHVGVQDGPYLALFEAEAEAEREAGEPLRSSYAAPGVNHFAVEVEALEPILARLPAAGTRVHLEMDYEPGRRAYFYDPDGIEIEIVSYAAAA
ncbi:MAG: VOC family protein [Myxococcota bacterium]